MEWRHGTFQCPRCRFKVGCCEGETGRLPARRRVTSLRVSERYTETAIHFDVERLPRLLASSLPPGPLALADLGCGDGPLFAALVRQGAIAPAQPVYAVDLEAHRLARVSKRFPWRSEERRVGKECRSRWR